MLKVWCVILILVAPISCGPIEEGTGKHLFQILCEYVWQEKCKNVSGVTIDDKRNNQLNLDYGICTTTAINENELKQDVASIFPDFDPNKMKDFHFTEKKKFDLVNMSQKYCHKINAFHCCSSILFPIYSDCFDAEELASQRVKMAIAQSISNYFRKNESDAAKRFIDGKVLECAMEKKEGMFACYEMYARSFFDTTTKFSIFSQLSKANYLCGPIGSFESCLTPLFDQCTLSETVGETVASLFREIELGTSCSSFKNDRTIPSNLQQELRLSELNQIRRQQNCFQTF